MGFWAWFWICAAVVVVLLIIASQVGTARGWAGRVFGRVLPVLGPFFSSNWVRAGALILFVGGPFCWATVKYIEGRGEARAQLEEAERDKQVAELEARIGALSAQLSENTARDARRVANVITQANEELADAVEADDFAGAYSVYRRAYDGVWNDLAPPGEPDPAARRPDGVRGATPDRA